MGLTLGTPYFTGVSILSGIRWSRINFLFKIGVVYRLESKNV